MDLNYSRLYPGHLVMSRSFPQITGSADAVREAESLLREIIAVGSRNRERYSSSPCLQGCFGKQTIEKELGKEELHRFIDVLGKRGFETEEVEILQRVRHFARAPLSPPGPTF